MLDIEKNLAEVRANIRRAAERAGRSPEDITIIAVTKTFGVAEVMAACKSGINDLGENRVQEAEPKIEEAWRLGLRPVWHMIGHLQTNKVKTALSIFDIIHSIDSVELAQSISRHASRAFPVLIEVNIAGEASKFGFTIEQVGPAVSEIGRLPNIESRGLMTVAPLVSNPEEVRPVFRKLRELRDVLGLEHLSMGMTADYEVAVEEGATLVRIGRAIFGERRLG